MIRILENENYLIGTKPTGKLGEEDYEPILPILKIKGRNTNSKDATPRTGLGKSTLLLPAQNDDFLRLVAGSR